MKILIVSDTHGEDEELEEVVEREYPFDLMIHCGDISGREDYIEAFVEKPIAMVRGNNDWSSDLAAEKVVEAAGHRIFVTHGHYYGVSWDPYVLAKEAKERNCDIVCFGHTHVPMVEWEDGVLLLNPGSLVYPRQRGRKASYLCLYVEMGKDPQTEIRFVEN